MHTNAHYSSDSRDRYRTPIFRILAYLGMLHIPDGRVRARVDGEDSQRAKRHRVHLHHLLSAIKINKLKK